MKKLIFIVALSASFAILYKLNNIYKIKEYVGLVIDKIGITQNSYNIRVDKKLKPYIHIYWLGDNGTKNADNLLLYNGTIYQKIPENYYGKNKIVIKTKSDSILYDKIGILKLNAFSKHNYLINLSQKDSLIIIEWNIDNWYSKKKPQIDTIVYNLLP